MRELFERIIAVAKADAAVNDAEMLLYLTEEVGEVATCIAVNSGLKRRKLDEPVESELADVLISTLGMLGRKVNYETIIAMMEKKLPKWERRTLGKDKV